MVRDNDGLTGLYYPGHWTRSQRAIFGPRVEQEDDPVFSAAITQLNEYFARRRQSFDLPVVSRGSGPARQVWQLLVEIPYGDTVTYGELARQMGGGVQPARHRRIRRTQPGVDIIPCHRVIGSTGKLTGCAGGLRRKKYLLELELAVPAEPLALW